jgi:hypothetical protein
MCRRFEQQETIMQENLTERIYRLALETGVYEIDATTVESPPVLCRAHNVPV